MHRIVMLRKHEPLEQSWSKRAFSPAGKLLGQTVKVSGMQFDEKYFAVRVLGRLAARGEGPPAVGFNYGTAGPATTFAVRVEFDDEEAVARLRRDRGDEVVGVFADPAVTFFPAPYCGNAAVGGVAEVAQRLGVRAMRAAGFTGRGVNVAVVDTGVNGEQVPVVGGWAPAPGYQPGSSAPGHGTMCAFDVRIAAPDARIWDYALLRSQAGTWTAFLSDGIAAFADLIERIDAAPGRWVVNNSWGMFNRADDAPIGSPENYSANPDHPFNQITASLVAAGADVFFAAGNCGAQCPDNRCGVGDVGPGASIHGANSHPDVITVAAVTVDDRRLGYSSQGPGGLYRRKPDLAGLSHFRGSGVYPADSGTSAASPVAAGVAAALRQRFSTGAVSPAQLKGLLQRTARDLEGHGWDFDVGYGVIDGAQAARALAVRRGPSRRPEKKPPRHRQRARA